MKFDESVKGGKFRSQQQRANLNVLHTAYFIYNKLNRFLKPFDLTHEQYNVLRILKGQYPNVISQKEVLSRMVAPSSNITLLIKKLLNKGLIERSVCETDNRQYDIAINNNGLNKLLEVAEYQVAEGIDLKGPLTDDEAIELNRLLNKLRE